MNYTEKDVQKIVRELKMHFNIRSRAGLQVLRASIDNALMDIKWSIAKGVKICDSEIGETIFADLNYCSIYFDGQASNIANLAASKIIAIKNGQTC